MKKTFVKNIIKIIHNDIKLYEKFYNNNLFSFISYNFIY
jgi:hypothetical protein